MISEQRIRQFRDTVWDVYVQRGRTMPWRSDPSPYHVVVSEIMLQQTQVDRVIPKFLAWVEQWSDFEALSQSTTEEVLSAWQGLGYNRRALWLKDLAREVVATHGGRLPDTHAVLTEFKGIGPNTAGAILAYAYEQPVVFIETNIRRVILHEFFPDRDDVADKEIMPIVEAALDAEHPREWYWALMDYGSELPKRVVNPNRRSKHYARQSKFAGSHRQLRGAILARVLEEKTIVPSALAGLLDRSDEEIAQTIDELVREGFLNRGENGITMKA